MIEEWKSFFDGVYSVSNLGRVRREVSRSSGKAGSIMRPIVGTHGYLYVQLSNGTARRRRAIHQLVAQAFIGECPPGKEVNHINADRADNRAGNLEYLTRRENVQHAAALGHLRGPGLRGEQHGEAKLTEEAVRRIRAGRAGGRTLKALADEHGVTIAAVRSAATGRTWAHVAMEVA